MNDKVPLYELTFTTRSNHSLAPRVEYLRCKSKELLVNAANQWMNSPYSEYYGYGKVEIYKVGDFPEIMSVELDIDEILPKKDPQIKKLEGKIVFHKKSIVTIKSKIHNIRGDKCTKPVEDLGCNGTCLNHYKCKDCNKIHLTKKGLQTRRNEEEKNKN